MEAKLEINLSNIKRNWEYLNSLTPPNTKTAAVLKANAYGLGADRIAPALWEAGARSFFVATIQEALELNNYLNENKKIYILNGYDKSHRAAVESYSFVPVLNSPSQLISFMECHQNKKACLQIDIGMKRLGFQAEELKKYKDQIKKLNLDLIIGHLSSADKPKKSANNVELKYFIEKTSDMPSVKKSIAASHGILLNPSFYFNVTRPGIALYGGVQHKGLLDVINITVYIDLLSEKAFVQLSLQEILNRRNF